MSAEVHWVLELDIREGKYDDLTALMAEMVAATKANEPGTTFYEWYVNDDRTTCHIYERYVDSAAVMVHLGTFGEKFAGRFMEALAPTRFTVYGDASQEVRDALAGLGAVHMAQVDGYRR